MQRAGALYRICNILEVRPIAGHRRRPSRHPKATATCSTEVPVCRSTEAVDVVGIVANNDDVVVGSCAPHLNISMPRKQIYM